MTTQVDSDKVRWALAERLEGMREKCICWCHYQHLQSKATADDYISHSNVCTSCRNKGFVPVPLADGGLIDEGRLRRAITHAGYGVAFLPTGQQWGIAKNGNGYRGWTWNGDLAIAYLRAVGAEGF